MPLRGYKTNKYHYCARCGDRQPIADMTWQNGSLICNRKCLDTGVFPVKGDRDKERARLEASYVNSRELQPDRKLTESSLQQEDDISFAI